MAKETALIEQSHRLLVIVHDTAARVDQHDDAAKVRTSTKISEISRCHSADMVFEARA